MLREDLLGLVSIFLVVFLSGKYKNLKVPEPSAKAINKSHLDGVLMQN